MCCTQYASKFGKLCSGHRTGKGQFSFQSQRGAMPKNAQISKLVAQLLPALWNPMDCSLLRPWNFPGENTRVGSHFLLQGIILTQGLNPGLQHFRQTLYYLSHQGSPKNVQTAARLHSSHTLAK